MEGKLRHDANASFANHLIDIVLVHMLPDVAVDPACLTKVELE